jgi:hypothetical protein
MRGKTECLLNVTLEPNMAKSNLVFLPHSRGILFLTMCEFTCYLEVKQQFIRRYNIKWKIVSEVQSYGKLSIAT